MKDLRKKDTRKSLKKTPGAPVKPTTLKPDSARVPPPRPTSPRPEIRLLGSSGGSELGVPPTKPLPPAPRSKRSDSLSIFVHVVTYIYSY